ncbi:MAG: response regulator [Nitrospinae bacterium]|nr:response regulator [Nitrospinota bacterium]
MKKNMDAQGKMKILIIDDEEAFCRNLKKFLVKSGYDALVCHEGKAALELVKTEKPDLITLDMRMPGMNGFEVLRELHHLPKTPIIFVLSAIDTYEAERDLLRMGVTKAFHKPINLEELATSIKSVLQERGAGQG